MSWRTVIVSSRCKLDTKMGYMVIRGEDVRRIFLDEIGTVIIENPAIALTGCLLSELAERKVKVIFCDNRHLPQSELVPYYGSHDTSRKLRSQLAWSDLTKGAIWGAVIANKITQQALLLETFGYHEQSAMLQKYGSQLEFQDVTNREGHAAKVYFNALFGADHSRSADTPINAALNYGYSILLSAFSREIVACGYLTQLGLHHENVFNRFNLSSDLMEPFRILIDRTVYTSNITTFDKICKRQLVDVLNNTVTISGTKQIVSNAIGLYVRSVFDALNSSDPGLIKFYKL